GALSSSISFPTRRSSDLESWAAHILVQGQKACVYHFHAREARRGPLGDRAGVVDFGQRTYCTVAHAVAGLDQRWWLSLGIPHGRIRGAQELPAARGLARVDRREIAGDGQGARWDSGTRAGSPRN